MAAAVKRQQKKNYMERIQVDNHVHLCADSWLTLKTAMKQKKKTN